MLTPLVDRFAVGSVRTFNTSVILRGAGLKRFEKQYITNKKR